MSRKYSPLVLGLALLLHSVVLSAQATGTAGRAPDQTWVGERIVMLHGWGAVHISGTRPKTAVGVNIVSPVSRVEGTRVWVTSTGADVSGWIDASDVLRLADAIPFFTDAITRNDKDWDAYFRRAEVKHAINDREGATRDYTAAIELHPSESFLYLRRARHYNTLKACAAELRDLEQAIALVPQSARQDYNLTAELLSLESGVYASCPEQAVQDPRRAITAARRAVDLDHSRPTLLTVLAAAYASAADFANAVKYQREGLRSRQFPQGYRQDAESQLRIYEQRAQGGR